LSLIAPSVCVIRSGARRRERSNDMMAASLNVNDVHTLILSVNDVQAISCIDSIPEALLPP
jgi:hypothetical protein